MAVEARSRSGVDVGGSEGLAQETLDQVALLVRCVADQDRTLRAGPGETGRRRLGGFLPGDRGRVAIERDLGGEHPVL